jgi:GNAT superfamily N-acetyltransferase
VIVACGAQDLEDIAAVVNDAAQAYRGVIPADRWKEPYMPVDELRHEVSAGVAFWGWREEGQWAGVMGLQDVGDVTLFRHAYVRTVRRNQGIGSRLLAELRSKTERPILIGTWQSAGWAVRFYEKHGFRLVPPEEKSRLLKAYWSIPERQVETSVVLADARWFARR